MIEDGVEYKTKAVSSRREETVSLVVQFRAGQRRSYGQNDSFVVLKYLNGRPSHAVDFVPVYDFPGVTQEQVFPCLRRRRGLRRSGRGNGAQMLCARRLAQ